MRDRNRPSAPNYTTAALTMGWVNLMWIFMVIWGFWGLLPVLLVSAGLNRGISWIAQRHG